TREVHVVERDVDHVLDAVAELAGGGLRRRGGRGRGGRHGGAGRGARAAPGGARHHGGGCRRRAGARRGVRGGRRGGAGGRRGGVCGREALGLLDEGVALLELVVGVRRESAAERGRLEVHLDGGRQRVALGAEGREVRAEALVLRVVARAARRQRPRVTDQDGSGEAADA